jgi:hypothetical protein
MFCLQPVYANSGERGEEPNKITAKKNVVHFQNMYLLSGWISHSAKKNSSEAKFIVPDCCTLSTTLCHS